MALTHTNCEKCGEMFSSYNPNPKFCSRTCKDASQLAIVDTERIKAEYIGGKTIAEVAELLKTTLKIVENTLKRMGVKRRAATHRDQAGSRNAYWKGGKTESKHGYIHIRCKGHPRAAKTGYIPFHVMVVEQRIGRLLKWFGPKDPRSEIVHHKNGDVKDNRFENLQITTYKEHLKFHDYNRKKK